MALVDLEADVLVAGRRPRWGMRRGGGGPPRSPRDAGSRIARAWAATPSSEVKMHVVGATAHRAPGVARERTDRRVAAGRCGQQSAALLGTVGSAAVRQGRQRAQHHAAARNDALSRRPSRMAAYQVVARCDKSEHLYRIRAKMFCDCTGDSRLGLEAGAEMRSGREARAEFGESLAPEKADNETLGSSILFTSRLYRKPMPFTPPKWARKITKEQLKHRQRSENLGVRLLVDRVGRRSRIIARQRAHPLRTARDRDGRMGLHQEQRRLPRQQAMGAWTGWE